MKPVLRNVYTTFVRASDTDNRAELRARLITALYEAERGDNIVFVARDPEGADIDGITLDILALGGFRYNVRYEDLARREFLDDGAAIDVDRVLAIIDTLNVQLAELAELEPVDEG